MTENKEKKKKKSKVAALPSEVNVNVNFNWGALASEVRGIIEEFKEKDYSRDSRELAETNLTI